MNKLLALTPSDEKLLKLRLQQSHRRRVNSPYREHFESTQRLPSAYVALTPFSGIPAKTQLTPAYDDCAIFKLVPSLLDPSVDVLQAVMMADGLTPYVKKVYNISDFPLSGDTFHLLIKGAKRWIGLPLHTESHFIRFTLNANFDWFAEVMNATAYDAWGGPLPVGTIQVYNHDTHITGIYKYAGKLGFKGTAVWDSVNLRFRIIDLEHRLGWKIQFTLGSNGIDEDTASADGGVVAWWGGPSPGGTVTVFNMSTKAGAPKPYMFKGVSGDQGYAEWDDVSDRWRIYQLNCDTGTTSPEQALRRRRS